MRSKSYKPTYNRDKRKEAILKKFEIASFKKIHFLKYLNIQLEVILTVRS